jgi:cytochrome P450
VGTSRDRQGDDGRPVVDYDHYSSFHAQSAISEERQLRRDYPIAWSEHCGGFWVLSTHELVTNAMRDYETFSSAKTFDDDGVANNGVSIPPSQGFRMVPVETDPPEWNDYRRILNPLFAPPAVERIEPVILAITTEMINRVIEKGEADLLLDLANPITALVTLHLLGLPLADWYAFANPIHKITYSPVGSPGYDEAAAGIVDIIERFRASIAEHRRRRKDDLISYLIDTTIDDRPLSDDTLVDLCFQILAGGVDTTTALLGSTFVYLDQHRRDRSRLAGDEALLRTGTEEFLRVFAPLPSNARTVARPTECRGQRLRPGERVLALLGSANRDAAIFEDPDEIRLDRLPNRHTSFGIGIHRCLGSNLARAMFRIIVTQVLRRMPDYRIAENGAEKYESIALVNGYVSVRVTFTPGVRVEGGVSI